MHDRKPGWHNKASNAMHHVARPPTGSDHHARQHPADRGTHSGGAATAASNAIHTVVRIPIGSDQRAQQTGRTTLEEQIQQRPHPKQTGTEGNPPWRSWYSSDPTLEKLVRRENPPWRNWYSSDPIAMTKPLSRRSSTAYVAIVSAPICTTLPAARPAAEPANRAITRVSSCHS